jgi:hypothetical protein
MRSVTLLKVEERVVAEVTRVDVDYHDPGFRTCDDAEIGRRGHAECDGHGAWPREPLASKHRIWVT